MFKTFITLEKAYAEYSLREDKTNMAKFYLKGHQNDQQLKVFYVTATRDGAEVRALTSHQCGPGSNPGVNAICGLSLFWFFPLLRDVFLQVLSFSPLLKNQHFQIPIQPGIRQTKNHFVKVLPLNHDFFKKINFIRKVERIKQNKTFILSLTLVIIFLNNILEHTPR